MKSGSRPQGRTPSSSPIIITARVCLLTVVGKPCQIGRMDLCPEGSPMDCSCQAPLAMGFSRQEYWSGLPCPHPGDLPNPGNYGPTALQTPSETGCGASPGERSQSEMQRANEQTCGSARAGPGRWLLQFPESRREQAPEDCDWLTPGLAQHPAESCVWPPGGRQD
ncbi:hypothetical protein AB1E18_000797 [Capra hircus]